MRHSSKVKLIKILKKTAAYLFLYGAFLGIFYYYSHSVWDSSIALPLGLFFLILVTLVFVILYALINHILIRRIVGLKLVVNFEIILIFIIYFQTLCFLIRYNS